MRACKLSSRRAVKAKDCSHLVKQMQVAAAHWQHFGTPLQMNIGGFVRTAYYSGDRTQIDDHGSMNLGELRRVELRGKLLQRRADNRLAQRTACFMPCDRGGFLLGAQEVDVLHRG